MGYFLGDSMIKRENGRNISDSMNVKVISHPGATTEDLLDYVKPRAPKKPKMLILHTGTNAVKKVKKVVQSICEIAINQEIQVAFSGIINRIDNNFAEKIKDRNNKLESYCQSEDFVFISNSKLDSSNLNRG